jgi:hypothetical protein
MQPRRTLGAAILVAASLALGGCGPKPFSISIGPKVDLLGPLIPDAVTTVVVRENPADAAFPARADAATVVFVRPSDKADALLPLVIDEQGRFLGQSLPASYFVTTVPPGEHVFVACSDEAAGMRARLAAGKRYFVELTWDGSFSRRVIPHPIRSGSESWGKLTGWYTEKKRVVEDGTAGEAYVRARPSLPEKCLRKADEELRILDAKALGERSRAPDDGP